jgi:hypothetical protein
MMSLIIQLSMQFSLVSGIFILKKQLLKTMESTLRLERDPFLLDYVKCSSHSLVVVQACSECKRYPFDPLYRSRR